MISMISTGATSRTGGVPRHSARVAGRPCVQADRRRHPSHDVRERRSTLLAAKGKKGFGELLAAKGKSKGKGKTLAIEERCPCGRDESLSYARCCKPYHADKLKAETPRKLLETRFSAYAKGLGQYLVTTAVMPGGSGSEEAESLVKDIEASCAKLKFVSLNVLEEAEHESGHAVIKFRYAVRTTGQKGFREGALEEVEETSHFLKRDGFWLFNEGTTDRNPN